MPGRRTWQPAAILAVAVAGAALNTPLDAPPRFDGAGYAVLARSLATGRGYRAIDHPDAPPHAHFPPGYPLVLGSLWRLVGPSLAAAHGLSIACMSASAWLFWRWYRSLYRPGVALLMGLATAANWSWLRVGGAIQSEPLYLMLCGIVTLRSRRSRGWSLGLMLGATMLTRHVGAALAVAVIADLWMRGRRASAAIAAAVASAVVAPWAWWLATVGRDTQVGRLGSTGLAETVASNALFYARRLPDLLVGPAVEVATVFRPGLAWPATVVAASATCILIFGWTRALRSTRRRLAGLVPTATLPLLLAWPYTEAGRFLLPLLPFALVGAVEGLAPMLARWSRRPRLWAASLLLAAALPYAVYALATDRAGAARRSQADFDAACAWIARQPDAGPVLTRQPGEVYWLAGRRALDAPVDDPAAIGDLVDKYKIAYILIDEGRYARAPSSPLGRYAAGRASRAWSSGRVAVYRAPRG